MKVAVVGGGPSGLYFARLLKRAQPGNTIDLFERNPERVTWGFGVGLGGRAMRELEENDPEVHAEIARSMTFGETQRIHLDGDELMLKFLVPMGAISRLALLQILTSACRDVGVSVRFDTTVQSASELTDYDLIVAADGINSKLRNERAEEFGTNTEVLTNHFAWYGVARAMRPLSLVFRTVKNGHFVAHYYPYENDRSTFVAECDNATWLRFGLDQLTDAERQSEIERIFAPELEGVPLVNNHSIWRQFPLVVNERWDFGNLVLLGDNLHSAHFSIGSGTRLAMEDAVALFQAVVQCGDNVPAALSRFGALRRPSRDKFGEAARRSFEWYENFAVHMRQPLIPFVYDFLTRTGRIGDERLKSDVPDFYHLWLQDKESRGSAG